MDSDGVVVSDAGSTCGRSGEGRGSVYSMTSVRGGRGGRGGDRSGSGRSRRNSIGAVKLAGVKCRKTSDGVAKDRSSSISSEKRGLQSLLPSRQQNRRLPRSCALRVLQMNAVSCTNCAFKGLTHDVFCAMSSVCTNGC